MTFEENLIELLKRCQGDGLYVGEDIPPKKLRHAQEHFPIPADVKVHGLLDCTVFGSCKHGLAFCASGLRWRNDWTTDSARLSLPWAEFKGVRIEPAKMEVRFDEASRLNLAGAGWSPERLAEMLSELQGLAGPEADRKPQASPAAAAAGPAPLLKKTVWHFVAREGAQVAGPVIGEVLAARLVEARADPAQCRLWSAESYRWRPLADFPDIAAELLAYYPLPQPPGPPLD